MQANDTTIKYGESENYPNAAKLMQSLRHLDYDNISAINDLIDNSIDAGATSIWIDILPGKKGEIAGIAIVDNGSGMDHATLDQALKLGSETGRNAAFDLGLYGMGLITASISMGRRLEIITKTASGEVLIGIQDVDEIIEKDAFVKSIEPLNPVKQAETARMIAEKFADAGIKLPKGQTPASFTIVTISKIDRPQKLRATSLADDVQRWVAQVFRRFIQSKKFDFYVDGKKVAAIDPIRDYEPTILTEENIKLEQGDINVVVVELKDYGSEINKAKGINITNQGFYVMRNNREISCGETLGLFTKHNDFNTLRIELSYPATLDPELNANFSKQRIRLSQDLRDKVSHICNPFIRQVRVNAKKRQEANRDTKEDFTNVEKYITQKLHLLKNPKVEIEKRDAAKNKSKQKDHDMFEHSRLDITKRQHIKLDALKVKFIAVHNTNKAPLWEADQERDVVIVKWNCDHPFYQRVVAPYAETPEVFNPIAYLIYCFAAAELIAKEGSDSQEMLDNIRYDVGRNLAVLLN